MPKDDLVIHGRIPEKAIRSALEALRLDGELSEVEWKASKSKPPRPTKVLFEADDIQDLRKAKNRLEKLLTDAGFDLYP